jgi:putative SOS response-associated peptidase YedK
MCNLYSITTNQEAVRALFRVINRYVGNLAPMPGIFPDYPAPVVRNTDTGRELTMMRWGMPPPAHRRPARDQYPQHVVAALARLAQAREPVLAKVRLERWAASLMQCSHFRKPETTAIAVIRAAISIQY